MLTITAVGDRLTPTAQEAEDEETTDIRIEIQKARYKSNESISVNFTGPTLGSDSWLGVVPADVEHGDSTVNRYNRVSYFDMEGQSIGTHIFENPGEGDWTIRMNEGSGDELAYVEFSVDLAEEEEITPIPVESEESNLQSTSDEGLYSVDKMMAELGPDFTNDLESLLSNPNQSIDEVRAAADEMAEEKIRDLPFLFQSPARRMWSSNADSILAKMVENLPPPEDLAKAAAVAGAVGVGAATVAAQAGLDAQTPEEAIVDAVVNTVVDHAAEVVLDTVSPTYDSTPDTTSEVAVEETPEPEVTTESTGLDLVAISTALNESRFLNDQVEIIEAAMGKIAQASVRVDKIERTFSIGIDDEYRGGQTIIGSIDGVGEVEVHLKASADISSFRPNHNSDLALTLHKWNGIRKRLELYAQ